MSGVPGVDCHQAAITAFKTCLDAEITTLAGIEDPPGDAQPYPGEIDEEPDLTKYDIQPPDCLKQGDYEPDDLKCESCQWITECLHNRQGL